MVLFPAGRRVTTPCITQTGTLHKSRHPNYKTLGEMLCGRMGDRLDERLKALLVNAPC
jgi:hypothetical protein